MKEVGKRKWRISRTSRSKSLGKENMYINMNRSINVLSKVQNLHPSETPSASCQKTLDDPPHGKLVPLFKSGLPRCFPLGTRFK
jgi:hypothetical protein